MLVAEARKTYEAMVQAVQDKLDAKARIELQGEVDTGGDAMRAFAPVASSVSVEVDPVPAPIPRAIVLQDEFSMFSNFCIGENDDEPVRRAA